MNISAACLCNTGKVRKRNEDNFFFDGACLEAQNKALQQALSFKKNLRGGLCVAVFDGMGGENFGDYASFAAADRMRRMEARSFFAEDFEYLNSMCMELNAAVVAKQKELCTQRMGSTMAALYFLHGWVYFCNLGDSRAYRLKDGKFFLLSEDHVEKRASRSGRKAPLTQHLGIDPEEMLLEPYISRVRQRRGDRYLLCSDGLTDMLTDAEICDIMAGAENVELCVQQLVDAALEKGGRDNVTAIVCEIC